MMCPTSWPSNFDDFPFFKNLCSSSGTRVRTFWSWINICQILSHLHDALPRHRQQLRRLIMIPIISDGASLWRSGSCPGHHQHHQRENLTQVLKWKQKMESIKCSLPLSKVAQDDDIIFFKLIQKAAQQNRRHNNFLTTVMMMRRMKNMSMVMVMLIIAQ